MTLIHTCQLCGANSFDYLTELQRHARELATSPAEWMPWNYRQTLERDGVPTWPERIRLATSKVFSQRPALCSTFSES